MKKIAFFPDNLDVGGIQKSLVNLLRNFDYEHFQVDLYLSDQRSFRDADFPEQLNIKYLKHIPRACSFLPFDLAKNLVSLDFGDCQEYDLAIDFNSCQFSCALGALTVPAKRRVLWIPNDVSVKLANEWKYRVLWHNFKDKFKYYDRFVGASKAVIETFMANSGIYDAARFTVIQNTMNPETLSQDLEGREPGERDGPREDNAEIIRRIKQLAEPETGPAAEKKTVNIIALHLGVGGVEKAIVSMANLFAERYYVNLFSIYHLPGSPAFPLDDRVKVIYMLRDVPNREEWKAALRGLRPLRFFRESVRSLRILLGKKRAVRRIIRNVRGGVLITTRHEDNLQLSKYGAGEVLKIAQMHHDHRFAGKYVRGFKARYGGVDVLTLLTPQLVEEVREMMRGRNEHTKLVYMPNFLNHYPAHPELGQRDKTVLAVGRLSGVKRFDLLIRQFARVHEKAPDWKLRILGDGEEAAALAALVHELGAEEYILLAGRKSGPEVEKEMCGAAFFAMSSFSEGFPYVLLEAQSCALPILAYDVRVGPGFIVHPGEDGYLVPEGEESLYEQRMLEMMNSPELLRAMGLRAMAEAEQFSRENLAEKWYSVIES